MAMYLSVFYMVNFILSASQTLTHSENHKKGKERVKKGKKEGQKESERMNLQLRGGEVEIRSFNETDLETICYDDTC